MTHEFVNHEVTVTCVNGDEYHGVLLFDGRSELVIGSADGTLIKIMKRFVMSITRVS